jgi:MoaA/NifB/PqqE/SkfB family radical SAM enzyme
MIPFRNIKRAFYKTLSEPQYGYQAFKRRFLSYLTYKFFNGYSSYPETISLFLTYRCNLRCKMCGQWGEGGVSRGYTESVLRQELSFEDIKGVIDDVKSFKPNITLFGGEPLLHKDWIKIVKYIKSAGLRCNIITNGILLSNNAHDIVNIGVDEIIFSLDGSRDTHDKIRGAKGVFNRAYEGLRKIKDLKIKNKKPHINIASTIFEENYHELDKMVDIASSIGAKSITFHHLIFISKEIYKETEEIFNREFNSSILDWSGFIRENLPNIDIELLIDKIREVKNKKTEIDISFYPNFKEEEIRNYYSKFYFTPSSYKCRCISPWMVSYIFPDGSLREFHSVNYPLGNIKKERFKKIWNGDKYKNFRKMVKKIKKFSVCSRCTEFYRY